MATRHVTLPPELFRNIVEYLTLENDDRVTLLDLSKCSRVLRFESQRLLFRNTTGPFWKFWSSVSAENAVRLHLKYLSCILLDPTRLGPYVFKYRQFGLACRESDFMGSPPGLPEPQKRLRRLQTDLWSLTELVLPLMINLTVLEFSAAPVIGCVSSATILRDCSFQLDTFVFGPRILDQDELTAYFFPAQRRLRHLTYYGNTKFLNRAMCPMLESLSADETALGALVSFPGLAILEIFNGFSGMRPPNNMTSILAEYKRARMLSVPSYRYLREKTYDGPLGIVLLKLNNASAADLQAMHNLPELRVLVIDSAWHLQGMVPSLFWSHKSLMYVDVETTKRLTYTRCHRPRPPIVSTTVETINLEGRMRKWWEGHVDV